MHTTLLRSQRNSLFLATRECGLDPADFEWKKVNTRWRDNGVNPVDQITHKPSGYYFAFDRYKGEANPRYSPSASRLSETDAGLGFDWNGIVQLFKEWLVNLKNEIIEPDLWDEARGESRLVAANLDDLENTPFSSEEQSRISASIHELVQFVKKTSSHSAEQIHFIEARLQYLDEAAQRLGRKDWITLAMGTFTNIVVGVALAPDAAKELMRTAGSLLGWVMGHVNLLT